MFGYSWKIITFGEIGDFGLKSRRMQRRMRRAEKEETGAGRMQRRMGKAEKVDAGRKRAGARSHYC